MGKWVCVEDSIPAKSGGHASSVRDGSNPEAAGVSEDFTLLGWIISSLSIARSQLDPKLCHGNEALM